MKRKGESQRKITMSFFVNNSDHVIFSCSNSLFASLKIFQNDFIWLVDTGASISAIKYKQLLELGIPYHKETSIIRGIGGNVEAIGYVYLTFIVKDDVVRA